MSGVVAPTLSQKRRKDGAPGNNNLRMELRRLRSVGLIKDTQPVASIRDGVEFDLASVAQLTDLGREWVTKLLEYEQDVRAEGDGK